MIASVANRLPGVLQQMLDLWNGGDLDPADVFARGCLVDGGVATFEPGDVAREIAKIRASFPDLRFTVEQSFSARGRHVLRMKATGSHTGDPFETEVGTAAATGRRIEFGGIEVFEIRDNRIVDVWIGWNFGALYATLGASF
jgi:predicted ester cyclase